MSSMKEFDICTRNLKRMYSVQRIPLVTANSIRAQLSSIPQLRAVTTSNLATAVSSAAAMQQQYQSFYKAATDLQVQISALKIPTSQITANLSFGLSEFRQALQSSLSVINSSKLPPSSQLVDEMRRSLVALSKAVSVISEDSLACEPDQIAPEELKSRAIDSSVNLLKKVESVDESGKASCALADLDEFRKKQLTIRDLWFILKEIITIAIMIATFLQGILPDPQINELNQHIARHNEILEEIAEDLSSEADEYPDCEILEC